jgi:hypothetical protein
MGDSGSLLATRFLGVFGIEQRLGLSGFAALLRGGPWGVLLEEVARTLDE